MTDSVLVIAAHPDDEALGCAGTMAKHIDEGDTVNVAFMTNGTDARDNGGPAAQRRQEAARAACDVIGVSEIEQFAFPDNAMDSVPLLDINKAVETVINKFQPSIIYTHFGADLNIDHRITNQATITAVRPVRGSTVRAIYAFEVLSSTEWQSVTSTAFQPNYIVDITPFLDTKLKSLSCYGEELREHPHSRSLETVASLAKLRGGTHGFYAAEAFVVERILNP